MTIYAAFCIMEDVRMTNYLYNIIYYGTTIFSLIFASFTTIGSIQIIRNKGGVKKTISTDSFIILSVAAISVLGNKLIDGKNIFSSIIVIIFLLVYIIVFHISKLTLNRKIKVLIILCIVILAIFLLMEVTEKCYFLNFVLGFN